MKSKRRKKIITTISSTQNRVLNNSKIHQPKVEMQGKKNPLKNGEIFLTKRERNNLLCVRKVCIEWERERENCKFIVRGGE